MPFREVFSLNTLHPAQISVNCRPLFFSDALVNPWRFRCKNLSFILRISARSAGHIFFIGMRSVRLVRNFPVNNDFVNLCALVPWWQKIVGTKSCLRDLQGTPFHSAQISEICGPHFFPVSIRNLFRNHTLCFEGPDWYPVCKISEKLPCQQ
jgi:hypothetical protein